MSPRAALSPRSAPPAPALRDALRLADRATMKVERVAIGGRPALLVDGLYADPHAVRDLALSLDFHHPAGLYPGGLALVSLGAPGLIALLNDELGPALGGRLAPSAYYRDATFGMTATPPDRLSPLQRQPHFDTFCDYAGVVYLNPLDTQGGTSFWRHRRTGLERAPGDRARVTPEQSLVVERMMLEGITDLADGYPVEATTHWEVVSITPMRFNRFVFYDARVFHSPHIPEFTPADDLSRARLTQNLFLELTPA